MGVTILSYQDRHVPVPESPVICVGYMLFHEAWLKADTLEEEARFQQLTSDFAMSTVSGANLRLDRLLYGDPKQEEAFLAIVNFVRVRLLGFGKAVQSEYVNQVLAIHEPQWKDHPLPTPWLHKILDLIEVLIQGGRLPPSDWLSTLSWGTFPSNRSSHKKRL